MDVIAIRGMRVPGRHGVLAHEKEHEQPFDIDVELEMDLSAAARSDALSDTIDYAQLHARIATLAANTSFDLLERLASEIAALALEDGRVLRATVTVAKPNLLAGATPSVTITRVR